ncbi:MAG TPA: hypothetical protein PKC28_00040 [Bdellovibrionales bacterium]|nr:hypothetical protein [Bdellovibrionales bacterium]
MNKKDLVMFLCLQACAVVVAGGSFALIEDRLWAGALAGSYFVLSGLFMVTRAVQWNDVWRSFCWYPLIAHVFGISIPMMVTRFAQAGLHFENVKILGLEGPAFHRLSTVIFGALVLGTLIDLARTWRATNVTRESVGS